jgi:hypothetical protein
VTNRLPTAVLCEANTAVCIYFLRISATVNTFDLRGDSNNFHINVTNGLLDCTCGNYEHNCSSLIDNIAFTVLDNCDGLRLCKQT